MGTAAAAEVLQLVEWTGNRLVAPGPGERNPDTGRYHLIGHVLRISPADPNSIKVQWRNKRVTIERRANLTFL